MLWPSANKLNKRSFQNCSERVLRISSEINCHRRNGHRDYLKKNKNGNYTRTNIICKKCCVYQLHEWRDARSTCQSFIIQLKFTTKQKFFFFLLFIFSIFPTKFHNVTPIRNRMKTEIKFILGFYFYIYSAFRGHVRLALIFSQLEKQFGFRDKIHYEGY